jgi:DNA-binding SARP family transcriptional activator
MALGAPKQKTVLGLLLSRANHTVSTEEMIEELWGDRPPPSATANTRLYAANLRRVLAADGGPALTKLGPAYVLTVEPASYDVMRFRELVARARGAREQGDVSRAAAMFTEAAELWRGSPLADVQAGQRLAAWRVAVDEERLAAVEELADTQLRLGCWAAAAMCARQLIAAQPLRERPHALLARALYLRGDVAGALRTVDGIRRQLAEHLGVDLGVELRWLQRAMLRRDARLTGLPLDTDACGCRTARAGTG